jgi:hypothetical protein
MTMIGSFQLFAEPYVMTQGGPSNSTLSVVLLMYEEGFRWWNIGGGRAFVLFALILLLTGVLLRRLSAERAVVAGTTAAGADMTNAMRCLCLHVALAALAAMTLLPLPDGGRFVDAERRCDLMPPRLLPVRRPEHYSALSRAYVRYVANSTLLATAIT